MTKHQIQLNSIQNNKKQVSQHGSEINHPSVYRNNGGNNEGSEVFDSGSKLVALRHHKGVWFGPVLILVLALFPWPYGYYVFLRIVISITCLWMAYNQWKHDDAISGWVVVFVLAGILYNPILPIHLTREIWTILNLVTAGLFIGHFYALKKLLPLEKFKKTNFPRVFPLQKKLKSKTKDKLYK